MTCEECRAMRAEELAQKPPETIPYYTHEKDMARMERANKRLVALLILCLAIIAGSWAGFAWYENQFADVCIEAEQDGGGTNIVSGGDLDYGAESQNYETNP